MIGNNTNFIDFEGALHFLNVSKPTLYRWLKEGRLRGHKAGKQWRFLRAELEQFVRGQPAANPLDDDLRQAIKFFQQRARERQEVTL